MQDRYGNALGTGAPDVAALYDRAMDSVLAGEGAMRDRFEDVVKAAPELPFGHIGLARARQIWGDMAGARVALDAARGLTRGDQRAEAQIEIMDHVLSGRSAEAQKAVSAHVADHPRDAMIAQLCCGVFGLIGFSGLPNREVHQLEFTDALMPHYCDDWWMLCQHAFSLCEVGRTDEADALIDRSLHLRSDHANAAHVRSHTWYEAGEIQAGLSFLKCWMKSAKRDGLIHGHLSWHVALWALGEGDTQTMWRVFNDAVAPGTGVSLPINVLTDTVSLLYRAELAGVAVDPDRWRAISDYATEAFPATSLGFIDVHAALAYAMVGDGDALARIAETAKDPWAVVTRPAANAFAAIARQDWADALDHLATATADHARLGGSRAQRDLLEFAQAAVLARLGRQEDALGLLARRRPVHADHAPVAALH